MKSITTKLMISIGGLTICILTLILYFSYSLANKQTNEVIRQQASLALKFDLAIRGYVGSAIRPIMYQLIDKDEFIVEAMSTSYVARSIFEEVRKEFPEYIIKFSSDNPRNPINQAGPEELKIIEHFNNNPNLKRWEGIITINDKKYMAKFNARRMEESCLYCHGDPKDAPASMIEKYGSVAGFNRELGKVIGMDTVAIPLNKITEKSWYELKATFPIFVIGLLLFFCAVIIVIKLLVINRLIVISKHFRSTAEETDYSQINPIDIQGKDEIFDLAFAYNTLTTKLKSFYLSLDEKVKQRTQRLEQVNEELVQEINEKTKAENALRESQARFKALHNASFGGIAIHAKGLILECNQGLSDMTGYSVNELVGMDGLLLIAEKSRDLVMGNIVAGYEKPYEAIGLRKNGEEYPVRLEARNVPYKGKQVRTVEFRDITEKKQAEEEHEKLQAQFIQAQKMESVGRLAGGVAHDFNNMLSVILGNAEILSEDLQPSHPSIENLKEIQKAAKKSTKLTRQLLAFARKQTISPKIINLNQTIEGMLKMLQRLIGEDIELLWQPDADLWHVKIDQSQIDQILANLCVNARDSIKDTGKIVIETGNVHFSNEYCQNHPGFTPGDYLQIIVSDTGHGMEKEALDNLFEPFFTTKRIEEGTGLGLATVYGIIKQNRGFINVYSELELGTTFKIYLPRYTGKSVIEDEKIVQRKPQKGNETILLVEDEEAILEMTKMMLERLGYTVFATNNPDKALHFSNSLKKEIHLLMTDVVMPSMNGRELAEKILKNFPKIKCLYMSGYTANVIAHRGILDEGLNFINKPFSKQELSTKIRELLDGEND